MIDAEGRIRISTTDGWGLVAGETLIKHAQPSKSCVVDLVRQLCSSPPASRPSAAWLRRVDAMVLGCPAASAALHDMTQAMIDAPPVGVAYLRNCERPARVSWHNNELARSILWASGLCREPWVVPLVAEVALDAVSYDIKLPNAAVGILERLATDEAIDALVGLRRRIKDRDVLKRIDKALGVVAEGRGATPAALVDAARSDLGLEGEGRFVAGIGDSVVTAQLDERNHVTVVWQLAGGRTVRRPPPEVVRLYPDEARQVKQRIADMKSFVAEERARFEQMPVDELSWPITEWTSKSLANAVTKNFAARLLWSVERGDGSSFVGLPRFGSDAPSFLLADRSEVQPGERAKVTLWHPLHSDDEAVAAAWRDFVIDEKIDQPFKQAFRETYVVTAPERATRTYSNRFAGHILRYQQAFALMRARRWSMRYLGVWDGPRSAEARRDFPTQGVRATFFFDGIDDAEPTTSRLQFCRTDQVRFVPIGAGPQGQLPRNELAVDDVPSLVFSETMRDVDLFVGICSIATDPTWVDRGEGRFLEYWEESAFGELSTTAEMRRGAITRLLPTLSIGERCRVDGKFLVVDGNVRTYKIHLGSGNVIALPSNRHLCIVASPAKASSVSFLPFEGDDLLSVVLSKAFLLSADDTIDDPTILAQLDQLP